MATATQTPRPTLTPAVPVIDRAYRMSLETYHRIAEAGILGPKDHVVLLDGVLVKTMTKGDPHITALRLAYAVLNAVAPEGWLVCKEDPIALPAGPTGHDSEPEPDITVIRGTIRDYTTRKACPEDVALVVEVAESSLRAGSGRAGPVCLGGHSGRLDRQPRRAGRRGLYRANRPRRRPALPHRPDLRRRRHGPGCDRRPRGRRGGRAGPPALTLWSNRAIRSLLFATMARQFQVGRSNPRTRRGGDSWRASRGHMAT